MSTSLQHKIVSFVLFNLLWLSAVAGRSDYLWLTIVLAIAQFAYSYWIAEIPVKKMAQLLAVGLLLEAIAISLGAIDFVGSVFPLWLALLWVGFAAMAPVALDWLVKMPFVAALLGAVSGPFTYYVGLGSVLGRLNRYSLRYSSTRLCGDCLCCFSVVLCEPVQMRG